MNTLFNYTMLENNNINDMCAVFGIQHPYAVYICSFYFCFVFFKKLWDQKFMCVYTFDVRAHQNATQKSCFTS